MQHVLQGDAPIDVNGALYSAECVELEKWKCTLTKNENGVISTQDVSEILDKSLALVGAEDGYDLVEVADYFLDMIGNDTIVFKVNTALWKKGHRHMGYEELKIVNDVIQRP